MYIAAHAPEEGETEAGNGKKFPNSSRPLVKTPDGFLFLDPMQRCQRLLTKLVYELFQNVSSLRQRISTTAIVRFADPGFEHG